jgi:hypothetical protein
MIFNHNQIRDRATKISIAFLIIAWLALRAEDKSVIDWLHEYGFFRLLCLVAWGTTIYLAFLAYIFRRYFWLWMFSITMLILSPVFPLYLGGETYLLIAVLLIVSLFAFKVPLYLRERYVEKMLRRITNTRMRDAARDLLKEVKKWDESMIKIDAFEHDVSAMLPNRLFLALEPEGQNLIIHTHNNADRWIRFPVKRAEDLEKVKPLIRASYERAKQEKQT